jgi:hypothetical protein
LLRLVIKDFDAEEWSKVVAPFADLSLMQCWAYAEAKARIGPWRVERGVFYDGQHQVGAFQALIRSLPLVGGGLVWINRAPLWRLGGETPEQPLVAMMAELRAHYADRGRMYLRLAPPAPEGKLGPGALGEAGLSPAGTLGWSSAVLDLTSPLEDLRKGLRQKWRNCLNKAERLQVEVRSGGGEALFAAFLESHALRSADYGYATSVTAGLLEALQGLLPEGRKLEAFLAYQKEVAVGSVLIAKYGDACEYLAGHSSAEGRRLNTGQLLLWRAVAAMKEQGFRRFDLGGMDKVLSSRGIYRFKDGLGGKPYRLASELEAVGGGVLNRLVRWRARQARAVEPC